MLIQAQRVLRHPLFAASLLLAITLAATGAFGTFRIILPLRLAYWVLATLCAGGSLLAVRRLLGRYMKEGWARTVAVVLAAAVPTTLVAVAAATVLIPAGVSPSHFPGFYPAAVVLNIVLLALWRLTVKRDVVSEAGKPDPCDDSVPPTIASKLPPKLTRSRLVVVEAQDHYLRVATREGDALVYMRFADALAALQQSDGVRVHRSWWVARASIESMKFANGRGELTLVDGTTVPVSRRFAPEAKQLARQPKP
jgi:hypothetical protein